MTKVFSVLAICYILAGCPNAAMTHVALEENKAKGEQVKPAPTPTHTPGTKR